MAGRMLLRLSPVLARWYAKRLQTTLVLCLLIKIKSLRIAIKQLKREILQSPFFVVLETELVNY